jgi:hypothetical protein
MFLRSLTKDKGSSFVGDVYKLHPNSSYSPVNALASATGTFVDLALAWHRFVERWAEGKIYAQRKPQLIEVLGLATGQYVFDSADDTGTTFSWNAPDLSAAVYKVLLNYDQWPAGTKLRVKFFDPNKEAEAIVYKFYRAAELERLQVLYDGEEMEIADADQLAKDGWGLLIVVSNGRNESPYTGTTPIQVEVGLGGDVSGDYTFVFWSRHCGQPYPGYDGSPLPSPFTFFKATKGILTANVCPWRDKPWSGSGTITRTRVTLNFQGWGGYNQDMLCQGTFSGTSTDGGQRYTGTTTYTCTLLQGGLPACTSTGTSLKDTLVRQLSDPCTP